MNACLLEIISPARNQLSRNPSHCLHDINLVRESIWCESSFIGAKDTPIECGARPHCQGMAYSSEMAANNQEWRAATGWTPKSVQWKRRSAGGLHGQTTSNTITTITSNHGRRESSVLGEDLHFSRPWKRRWLRLRQSRAVPAACLGRGIGCT